MNDKTVVLEAGSDMQKTEPSDDASPLWTMNHAIITPHMGRAGPGNKATFWICDQGWHHGFFKRRANPQGSLKGCGSGIDRLPTRHRGGVPLIPLPASSVPCNHIGYGFNTQALPRWPGGCAVSVIVQITSSGCGSQTGGFVQISQ